MMSSAAANSEVLCNWGSTLKQSSAVHIQASYSADGILLNISNNNEHFIINLARSQYVCPHHPKNKACQSLLTLMYYLAGLLTGAQACLICRRHKNKKTCREKIIFR